MSLGREAWVDLDEGRCNEPGRVGPEKVQGRVDSHSSEGAASEKVQIGQGSAIAVTVGGLARGAVPALQRSDAAGAAAAIGGPPHQAPWLPVIIGGDEDVRRPSSDPHSQGSIEFLRGQVPQRRVSCKLLRVGEDMGSAIRAATCMPMRREQVSEGSGMSLRLMKGVRLGDPGVSLVRCIEGCCSACPIIGDRRGHRWGSRIALST